MTENRTFPGVVAVPEMAGQTVGSIAWWRLSGSIRRTDLELLWLAAGLKPEDLPRPTTPAEALRRAALSQSRKDILVRSIGKGEGWALVRESQGEGAPEYQVQARVVLVGGYDEVPYAPQVQVMSEDPDGGHHWLTAPENHPAVTAVDLVYRDALTSLSADDIGTWLVRRAEAMGAVRLRESGGIYFIPRDHAQEWHHIADILHHCSEHRVSEVPALRSDEAVEAVLDAVAQEVTRTMTQVEEDLSKGLGSRALEGRVKVVVDALLKVEKYGALLGRGVETFTEKPGVLQSQVVEAHLMAQAKAEEEKASK